MCARRSIYDIAKLHSHEHIFNTYRLLDLLCALSGSVSDYYKNEMFSIISLVSHRSRVSSVTHVLR